MCDIEAKRLVEPILTFVISIRIEERYLQASSASVRLSRVKLSQRIDEKGRTHVGERQSDC